MTIERIWIFEGKSDKTFPKEKKLLTQLLSKDFEIDTKLTSKTSLAISLAGDGSLLSMVRNMGELRHQVPVLGIHTSAGLGFLHRLAMPRVEGDSKTFLERFARCLKKKEFDIEKRWGIEAKVNRDHLCWGMNDVVISKGSLSRMVSLKLSVNGSVLFPKIRGDGLIIATPTGSTAYSLAAGGPIVMPGLEAMIVVPILPHELSQRPLVLSTDSKIVIEILDGPSCFLTEDGQRTTELRPGQSCTITSAKKAVSWLNPRMSESRNYFELLRTKLGLGGKDHVSARKLADERDSKI